jgi:hypothetical protein
VEATTPSGPAAMASTGETSLPQLVQELKARSRLVLMRDNRLSTSTCGSTSRRRSPRAPSARSEWRLAKEAQGLHAAVRGARRTSTPSRRRWISHASFTAPPPGRQPTPRVSAASSKSSSTAPTSHPAGPQSSRLKVRRTKTASPSRLQWRTRVRMAALPTSISTVSRERQEDQHLVRS